MEPRMGEDGSPRSSVRVTAQRLYFSGGPRAGSWHDVEPGTDYFRIPLLPYERTRFELVPADSLPVEPRTGSYSRTLDHNWAPYMLWCGEVRLHWSTYQGLDDEAPRVLAQGLAVAAAIRQAGYNLERDAQWWLPSGLWRTTWTLYGIPVRYRKDLPDRQPILVFHALPSAWRAENRPKPKGVGDDPANG